MLAPKHHYSLKVKDLPHPVTVRAGDQVIAESSRAKVMYETRLAPVFYLPKEDVKVPLEPVEGFNTFCPFKGTASYWNVATDGDTLERRAWSYKAPLQETKAVGGDIAFAKNDAISIDISDNVLEAPHDPNISGPTVDWLVRHAWLCPTPEALIEAFANKLIEDGVSIMRVSILVWSLHPMIAGRTYIWDRDKEGVKTNTLSHEILDHPAYANNPLKHVAMGFGGVRQHLDVDETEFDFPIMQELKARGATDYVAMPFFFSSGKTNVLTITSDHPKGFTTANLGHVFECATNLGRFFEVFALRNNASSLLETYLGRGTGARVLSGEIRRGDGDEIDAAILFCDLRHSTKLESICDRPTYLNVLNTFFDAVTESVNSHGGEVLKFIGDAVLAVFPADQGRDAACAQALDAAEEITQAVEKITIPETGDAADAAIGIAYGNVAYGNVGSSERLDFTVIGAAANIAARLSDLGKKEGYAIAVEDQVAQARPGKMTSLGAFDLHNVSDTVEAWAPAGSEKSTAH